MPFVIRRKADGKFAYGRDSWRATWVDELDRARVYPTKGNATTSLRHSFNSSGRYRHRDPEQPEDNFEIVPVSIKEFSNTPTVVAVLATDDQGQLIAVRRNNQPGKGLLGLPGGYHMAGETWQEAGSREFLEETGLWVDPESLKIVSMVTDEYGNNLVIAKSHLPVTKGNATPDPKEVQKVVRLVGIPVASEVAFPRHWKAIFEFLAVAPTVTLDKSYVDSLQKDSDELERLEAYGVDNWQGYHDAINDTEGYFTEGDE